MEAAISSIEVEVSSAAWAWPWAPCMMSRAFAEISPAEEATCTEASWMLSTTSPQVADHLVEAAAEGPDLVLALGVQVDHEVALGDRARGQDHVLQRAQPATDHGPAQREAHPDHQRGEQQGLDDPPALHLPQGGLGDRHLHPALHRLRDRRRGGPELLAHPRAPARARHRSPEEQHGLALGRERLALLEGGGGGAGQVADRPCRPGPGRRPWRPGSWRRPRRSARPRPPASTAPSRNWARSGLSSVRTPYFALKARLLATYRPRLTIWSRRTASPATRS